MMKTRLLLPIAALSALALAACENTTDAPDIPDPDAGNPTAFSEPVEETPANGDAVMSPQEMQQRRQEIEEEAQQTFDSIMENTRQTGDNIIEFGNDAMSSLTEQMDNASDAIESQIDTLVANAEQFRDENLTDEQKLEIVANIRATTEEAARALGQTPAEIASAGDTAEARARAALDI